MGPHGMMDVPTEQEWGDWRADLDRRYAHGVFAGQTREEALSLFAENVIERTEDLRFMPPIPLRYYLLAFRDFVLSERILELDAEAADAAACFLSLVLEMLETEPAVIRPIMGELLPAAESVARRQKRFEAPVEIYGSFAERVARIRALSEAQA